MIQSTTSSDRATRTDAASTQPGKAAPRGPGSDQLSTEKTEILRAALEAQPEVRPEVVARGRALAADSSWPTPEILTRVGEMIVSAPDLSESVN